MPTTDATARDITTLALKAIGAVAASESPSPEESQFALDICNGMLDAFVVDRILIFNVDFDEYALTSGQYEYLFGPGGSGDFDVATRPSKIVSAQLKLNTSPATYVPLTELDDDGWAAIQVLDIPVSYPTKYYYSPSWPDGILRFWVKPQASLSVRLETWNQFTQFTDLDTAFSFPQGYYELIWTNLAERLCIPTFGMDSVPASISKRAADAMARVTVINMTPPAQMIADGGCHGGQQARDTGYRNLYNPAPIWYR